METFTCQICGRQIKASKGLIAHHGYKRPAGRNHGGYGWQTASCMGARYLPYEQSCERIPEVIGMIEKHIIDTRNHLANYIANPPEKLYFQRGSYGMGKEVMRPQDFVSDKKNRAVRFYQPEERDYIYVFDNAVNTMTRDIEGSKVTLEYLQDRLNNWVKVA